LTRHGHPRSIARAIGAIGSAIGITVGPAIRTPIGASVSAAIGASIRSSVGPSSNRFPVATTVDRALGLRGRCHFSSLRGWRRSLGSRRFASSFIASVGTISAISASRLSRTLLRLTWGDLSAVLLSAAAAAAVRTFALLAASAAILALALSAAATATAVILLSAAAIAVRPTLTLGAFRWVDERR